MALTGDKTLDQPIHLRISLTLGNLARRKAGKCYIPVNFQPGSSVTSDARLDPHSP